MMRCFTTKKACPLVIDSSALVAILADEPEAEACARAIRNARHRRISAVTFVETAVVIDSRRDPGASRRLDELVRATALSIEPVDEAQAVMAREAYRDFGRGSGHPAQLNFGDCFSYALAKLRGEPLLFKGSDFVHTDIMPALA
jgi:ribonuclease VapC